MFVVEEIIKDTLHKNISKQINQNGDNYECLV